MTQDWIVALLVGFAVLYSIWYLLPAAARERLGRFNSALGKAPGCGSACGSCAKCPGSTEGTAPTVAAGDERPITFQRKP